MSVDVQPKQKQTGKAGGSSAKDAGDDSVKRSPDLNKPAGAKKGAGGSLEAYEKLSDLELQYSVQAVAGVLLEHPPQLDVAQAAAICQPAISELYCARIGTVAGYKLKPAEALTYFQKARAELGPLFMEYTKDNPEGVAYVDQLNAAANLWESTSAKGMADEKVDERVKDAVLMPDGKSVLDPDAAPAEQLEVLSSSLPDLRETLEQFQELGEQLTDEEIDSALGGEEASLPPGLAGKHGRELVGASIEAIGGILNIVAGAKTLTDHELHEKLANVRGFFDGVQTYTELAGAVVKLAGGLVTVTAGFAGALANAAGQADLAKSAFGLMGKAGKAFGSVVAAIEIVHGIATMLDKHATADQKVDAAWDTAIGVAGAVDGPLGLAVWGGKALFDWEMGALAELNDDFIEGALHDLFEDIRFRGSQVAGSGQELQKVLLLLQGERDPQTRARLSEHVTTDFGFVQSAIANFWGFCDDQLHRDSGMRRALLGAFQESLALRGSETTPAMAVSVASEITSNIREVFKSAATFVRM
jgi:hypothetical protein